MSDFEDWQTFRGHLKNAQEDIGKALVVSNCSNFISVEVHTDVKELQTMLERLLRSMG